MQNKTYFYFKKILFLILLVGSFSCCKKKDSTEYDLQSKVNGSRDPSKKCTDLEVEYFNNDIKDLVYLNNFKKKILEKFNAVIPNKNIKNINTCVLYIETSKNYYDSLIDTDGTVSNKNVKFSINYMLKNKKTNEIFLKKKFSTFYSIKILKYQYSNEILYDKMENNNINMIINNIFPKIKKYF